MDQHNERIKAVFWDNLGVLSFTVGGSYLDLWMRRLGVPGEEALRVLTSRESDLLDLGEMSKDDYFDYVLRELQLPEEKRAMLELSSEHFCYDKVLHGYIGEMRSHFTTVLLSVMPLYAQEFIRAIWPEFEMIFDHVIVSSEVHLTKPDPRIYRLALARAGCTAGEAVFVDDSRTNVEAARELGIRSILYENREQVLGELEEVLLDSGTDS
jgi:epoxide hydrolase-like predicted phosphatase